MTTIKLSDYTELEQTFIKYHVENWNDLMFTTDIVEYSNLMDKKVLSGVAGSLVKKGVISVYSSPALTLHGDERNIGEFQFVGDDGTSNFEEAPTLV